MNIIVKTYSGKIISRPDTSWEKDSEDFYPPDFIESITLSPVIFAKICKAGKSVSPKFAERYYDSFGYGLLLYPENLIDGSPEGLACASCIDHTSFLPFPLYEKGRERGNFILYKDGEKIFQQEAGRDGLIEESISEASERSCLRTGDLVAIELAPRNFLTEKITGRTEISASYEGNKILDFRIIFG